MGVDIEYLATHFLHSSYNYKCDFFFHIQSFGLDSVCTVTSEISTDCFGVFLFFIFEEYPREDITSESWEVV